LIYALGVGACIALARWAPAKDSFSRWLRNYFLFLLTVLWVIFGLMWLSRRLGIFELGNGLALFFLVFGIATVVGAAAKIPTYWEVASSWTLLSSMPDRLRQSFLVLAGLGCIAFGGYLTVRSRQAYRTCEAWYSAATTKQDSVAVSQREPEAALRPPRGRFDTHPTEPLTCSELTR
jgi:hypothetical protein